MGRPQTTITKRQREQARLERRQQKEEKRAQRKPGQGPEIETEVVRETPEIPTAG